MGKMCTKQKRKVRNELYQKQGGLCAWCKRKCSKKSKKNKYRTATIDHIIPVSKGGSHNKKNLQMLCEHCNGVKDDSYRAPRKIGEK